MNFVAIILRSVGCWEAEEYGRFQYRGDAQRKLDEQLAGQRDYAAAIVPLDAELWNQKCAILILTRANGWTPLDLRDRIDAAAARLHAGESL